MRDSDFRQILALGALLLSCCSLTACGERAAATSMRSAPTPAPSDELRIVRGDLVEEILLTGEIAARDAVPMITPNANIWPVQVRRLVEDGTVVAEGDVIAEFDNNQLVVQLDNLESQALTAENELLSRRAGVAEDLANAVYEEEQARAQWEKAKLEADLPEGLLAEQEYAQRRLELRRTEVALATARRRLETSRAAGEADLKILEVALEKARNEVEQGRYRLNLMTLRAPRDGIVLVAEDWREGRLIRSGDNVYPGSPVASLPDLTTLYVKADLFDVDDGRLEVGDELTATLDALPDAVFEGRVISIDEVAQAASRRSARRAFSVGVQLDGLDPETVRPGMSVKATARRAIAEDVLLAPRAALDWSETTPRAALRNGGFAEPTLGACNAHFCAIVDGAADGLQEDQALRAVGGTR